jgi:DNA-binding CsgD family transcriptional regulator/uncharacterized protein YjiS (DUF1127 family)
MSGSTRNLTATQLRRAVRALAELSELEDIAQYPQSSARLVRRLIPCEIASFTLVDPGRTATAAADPVEGLSQDDGAVFARYAPQHPLISHFASTQDPAALRISDFMTRRQLHATELYDYIYRPIATEYQLAVSAPSTLRPSAIVGLTVSRSRRDFTEAERELLELVAPQFRSTLRRLSDRALIDAMLAARDNSGAGVALIDSDGLIVRATTPARDAGLSAGEPLPRPLQEMLTAGSRRLQLSLGDSLLSAELIPDVGVGLRAVRLTPVQRPPDAAALRGLGVTPRQAEVLALIVRGRTTGQIAVQLRISARTVEKHLEAVYARLGVANRSQAIVRALDRVATD